MVLLHLHILLMLNQPHLWLLGSNEKDCFLGRVGNAREHPQNLDFGGKLGHLSRCNFDGFGRTQTFPLVLHSTVKFALPIRSVGGDWVVSPPQV